MASARDMVRGPSGETHLRRCGSPERAGAGVLSQHGAQDLNPHWLVWPDITKT